MRELVLATCDPLPEPDPDAALLTDALAALGVNARWAAWDAPARDFAGTDLVVLRSTWDYIHRLDAFLAWADRMGERLVNAPSLVRWNAHKGYLVELEKAGLAIVPTLLAKRGEPADLQAILDTRGWTDVVVKPAVSAGSYETRRVHRTDVDAHRAWFEGLAASRDVLLQPYVSSVETYGERSFIYVDGEVTHSVRKTPRFSGDHEAIRGPAQAIRDEEREFAHRAIALGERLGGARAHYGRVDVARDDDGRLMLMELELIEPSLFFDRAPAALARFVRMLQHLLEHRE